jgi:hypothetical protein
MNNKAGRKKGQILTLTLLVMMVGAIIMAVFFQYLGASLALAIRGEERANTYYAADSGFEDGFYWLQQGKELGGFWAWNEGEEQWERENYELNDRTVQVGVEDTGNDIYKITSKAISDEGRNTVVESYVYAKVANYFEPFSDSVVITSHSWVYLRPGSEVMGNISVNNADESLITNKGTWVGDIVPLNPDWPTAGELSDLFLYQVDETDPFPSLEIDVSDTPTIGPLYRNGNLEIGSTVDGAAVTLNGTIYVNGDLQIGGSKEFTLDLNGNFIFATGWVYVSDKCTLIQGVGAVVAVGHVSFAPKVTFDENSYIFVMSIESWVEVKPNGNFYGSIVGYEYVEAYPGGTISWTDPGLLGFQFPSIHDLQLLTYTIVD